MINKSGPCTEPWGNCPEAGFPDSSAARRRAVSAVFFLSFFPGESFLPLSFYFIDLGKTSEHTSDNFLLHSCNTFPVISVATVHLAAIVALPILQREM